MLSKLTRCAGAFWANRRGNVAILFGLTLLPMLGLLGLAVDFSLELKVKTALDAGLDAAVLAAATQAEEIIQAQATANYDPTNVAISYGQIAGQQVFTSNTARVKTAATPPLSLTCTRSGLVINCNGSYTSQSSTVIGNLFGTQFMQARGSAQSSVTLPKYMNVYIGYDISQSMGIASTQTDMSNMVAAVKTYYTTGGRTPQNAAQQNGCVFGCHVTSNVFQNASDATFESIGHNAGVSLRIDALRQAILNIIASAQPQSGATPTIALGLYSLQFAETPVYNPSTSQPSSDYGSLTTAASAIDLGNNNPGGTGDTDLPDSLSSLASLVSASGDGSSANSRQSFVFIITDGVADVAGNCTDGHCTQAFDKSWCDAFRAKGATIGVIYTTYIPIPNDQSYIDLVQPFASNIKPNLQACASPGYFYEASDGPAIQQAAQALFAQATASSHLTN